MRFKRQRGKSFKARRRRAAQQAQRAPIFRRPSFEPLETRDMLTTLSMYVDDFFPGEHYGLGATSIWLTRDGGDLSQPLTVTLISSDESELVVPESVTFLADETTIIFPVDAVDDTLLDGEQLVTITATAGFDYTETSLLVQDHETASLSLDQSALSPGDTLTGTIWVSVSGNTEPVSMALTSTRPNEIASTVVEVPVGQQSVDFSIPVTTNAYIEGPHAVKIEIAHDSGFVGNSQFVSVADPGVNTLQPVDDGHARDTDRDGVVFEELQLTSHQFTTQAASASFGESRGILEFDVSSIPSGASIQSAVLTLDVTGQSGTTPLDLDIFAYGGNGIVEVSDATQTASAIGRLTTTPGIEGLKSVPVVLDTAMLQSLVGSGGFVGFVTKVAPAFANTGRFVSILSREMFREYSRPSLHLVWSESNGPVLTANSLAVNEGGTVVLTGVDLAATDSDSDAASLVFTVTNVNRGQFLVGGAPATSFTQADIAAGLVAFVHDDSELAPSYVVTVSDGTTSFGPQGATISFSNVNDNPPVIVSGQAFEVGENAPTGAIVGTLLVHDTDLPGDPLAFEIVGGNDDGVFTIDTSGVLRVADATLLDFETANQYALTVAAFDTANVSFATVTIYVLDEAETLPVLTIDDLNLYEVEGAAATFGHVVRQGGDLAQPLTVLLTTSDPAKLIVPQSIVFNEFETEISFPIEVLDDTLLGDRVVTVTASAVGGESTSVNVNVLDVELVMLDFDATTGSPGDTLNATISVTTTDRTEPLTVWFESTRPDEIASMPVVIGPSQQSVVVPVPILADGTPEGLHQVTVTVNAEGYNTVQNTLSFSSYNQETVELFDPGVLTIFPVDDSSATDADQDGSVFEQLAEHSHTILTRAASVSGAFGESRGILEFDTSAVSADAIIESAVLTIDVSWVGDHPEVNDVVMDVFGYQGNGNVESADANEITNSVGQLMVETDGDPVVASFAIPLDVADVQALVDSGSFVGLVTRMQESMLQYWSKEVSPISARPALHLVLAFPPVLTANTLTLSEGETTTLSAANLAAADADSNGGSLTFTVSNVTGGQFLVNGSPATSFTQAQVSSGVVAFAHDGGEAPPAFAITVSDGSLSDGPHAAPINFTNVNDNAPAIPVGQVFGVSEHAASGTLLGYVTFGDADLPGDTLSASIVAGNSGGIFGINNDGELFVADNANLDFESASSHALTIRVSDGVHATDQVVTVDVLDVPETRFYVVDDATANHTYEYTSAGASMENYALDSGNSAPRGAASTAAGDRVWVVDANRRVYVYDAGGALLGSWTAGSMPSSATPEGIATDGTDVWIVDSKTDKVLRYAGAASRLFGSQNASASFNLNNGNSAAKDIVTDGASLWVVNDSTTDKVFKYTIGGSLLGSWTIDSENSIPTGITIDPSDVSDIWIVDSGSDRVYQYSAAADRTAGSQSASASFALAGGNSNPQGIADPPIANVGMVSADTGMRMPRAHADLDTVVHFRPHLTTPAKKRAEFEARDAAFASIASPRIGESLLGARRQAAGDGSDMYWYPASFDEAEQDDFDFSLKASLLGSRFPRVAAELLS
ncbi:MAG TPA: cadherin-like domain-containing protein [Lacipirellulaceae bacterium]